jgi:hypothetical protein
VHHRQVPRPIDAGDAKADSGGDDHAIADRLLHHLVQDLLDFELADRLQVRAAAPCLGQDGAVFSGEKTDRLRSACVQAQHVQHCGDESSEQ